MGMTSSNRHTAGSATWPRWARYTEGKNAEAEPRREPRVAMSLRDGSNLHRCVAIRGEVIDAQFYEELTVVNELSRKYTGVDYQYGHAGEERYKLTIRVDAWTAQE